MSFRQIEGNERAKRILKLALERRRLPNSLLFSGPQGVGKMGTALTLAKALNCRRLETDSCDECDACRAVDEGRFPDVMIIDVKDDKKAVAIEQIRLLRQLAYLRPMAGKRRVFIIDDAENMSTPAANSLLKVLEEPPPLSHIVLLAAAPHLLLSTIRSRCRTLSFSALTGEEIERALRDEGRPEDEARLLALLAGGSLRRARELDGEEVRARKEASWELFEALVFGARPSLFLDRFGTVPKAALEEFRETLELLSSFARDILLLKLGGETRLLLNPDQEERLRAAAARASSALAMDALAEFDRALAELPGNANKNLLAASLFSRIGECRHV